MNNDVNLTLHLSRNRNKTFFKCVFVIIPATGIVHFKSYKVWQNVGIPGLCYDNLSEGHFVFTFLLLEITWPNSFIFIKYDGNNCCIFDMLVVQV